MKIIFTILNLLLFSFIYSQSKSEFRDVSFAFGEILNDACSSASHDLEVSIDWGTLDINYNTGSVGATMKISWIGSWTDSFYWIKGKLVLDEVKQKIYWYKHSDSGGFPSNCSLKIERKYPAIVIVK